MYTYDENGNKIPIQPQQNQMQTEGYRPSRRVEGFTMDKDKKKWLLIILAIIVVIVLGYFAYNYFYKKEGYSSMRSPSATMGMCGMNKPQKFGFRFY
jgi:hypothetical protein